MAFNNNFAKQDWPTSANPSGNDLNDIGATFRNWGFGTGRTPGDFTIQADQNGIANLGNVSFASGKGITTDLVISSGKKIIQDAWTSLTLSNGWLVYGTPYGPLQYRVDKQGRLWLVGSITGGTITDGTTIATLPVGARPATYNQIIPCAGLSSSGTLTPPAVVLETGGAVKVYGLGSNVILHINGSARLD